MFGRTFPRKHNGSPLFREAARVIATAWPQPGSLGSASRPSLNFLEDRLFRRGRKLSVENLRVRQASETVSNECIAVCDLPIDVECAGATLQKPDYFLLDGVVKARKWRNEIDLIGIGAGFRSPLSTAQTAHLNASCLIFPLCRPYCSVFVLIGQGLCCDAAAGFASRPVIAKWPEGTV